jgi:hypothetical protein
MATIVTRAGKGSALTHTEVDANFTNLNTDKLQSGDTAATLTITSADINGGTIDGTSIGSSSASTGAFTTLSATGVTTVQAGTVSAPAITTSGDTNTGIFFPAADTIAFTEGGVESMRIDSSGNLGLGVTPSAWSGAKALQIGSGAALCDFGDSNVLFGSNLYFDGSNTRYINTDFASYYQQNNGIHIWTNAPSGTAGNAITFTQAMTLDASGNLGIGTTSPGATLHVLASSQSAIFASSSATLNYTEYRYNTTTTNGYIGNGGILTPAGAASDFVIRSEGALAFATNGATERARITSGGDLLVNKTATGYVNGNNFSFEIGGGTAVFGHVDGGGTANDYCVFIYNTSRIGGITQNGASAVSYNTSSDYRLKHDIQPMTGALAKVAQLKPVTYKWNVDDSESQGFIAHELQAVVPNAVTGEKDGEEMQGVDYGKITPLLTAALQEAIAEIKLLKARVAELEEK